MYINNNKHVLPYFHARKFSKYIFFYLLLYHIGIRVFLFYSFFFIQFVILHNTFIYYVSSYFKDYQTTIFHRKNTNFVIFTLVVQIVFIRVQRKLRHILFNENSLHSCIEN